MAENETTPQVAMKAEVSFATTLTGEKTKIGYVQKVGQLKTLKEGQTYSALDLDEERMAKGKRKADKNSLHSAKTDSR